MSCRSDTFVPLCFLRHLFFLFFQYDYAANVLCLVVEFVGDFAIPPLYEVDLKKVLGTDLPVGFKIPLVDRNKVIRYPNHFVVGNCCYGTSFDFFIEHQEVTGSSETTVVALDYCWINAVRRICGVAVYLDEHDISSSRRLRPDATLLKHGVLVCKVQPTANEKDIEVAKTELSSKLHAFSLKLLPRMQFSFFGMLPAAQLLQSVT